MVRDVFRLAKENSPAIIFIDEIDAIATKRFDAQTGADREVQRILLELLNQMDGFDQTTNVKVLVIFCMWNLNRIVFLNTLHFNWRRGLLQKLNWNCSYLNLKMITIYWLNSQLNLCKLPNWNIFLFLLVTYIDFNSLADGSLLINSTSLVYHRAQ